MARLQKDKASGIEYVNRWSGLSQQSSERATFVEVELSLWVLVYTLEVLASFSPKNMDAQPSVSHANPNSPTSAPCSVERCLSTFKNYSLGFLIMAILGLTPQNPGLFSLLSLVWSGVGLNVSGS